MVTTPRSHNSSGAYLGTCKPQRKSGSTTRPILLACCTEHASVLWSIRASRSKSHLGNSPCFGASPRGHHPAVADVDRQLRSTDHLPASTTYQSNTVGSYGERRWLFDHRAMVSLSMYLTLDTDSNAYGQYMFRCTYAGARSQARRRTASLEHRCAVTTLQEQRKSCMQRTVLAQGHAAGVYMNAARRGRAAAPAERFT
jgi:hypothetical protein